MPLSSHVVPDGLGIVLILSTLTQSIQTLSLQTGLASSTLVIHVYATCTMLKQMGFVELLRFLQPFRSRLMGC